MRLTKNDDTNRMLKTSIKNHTHTIQKWGNQPVIVQTIRWQLSVFKIHYEYRFVMWLHSAKSIRNIGLFKINWNFILKQWTKTALIWGPQIYLQTRLRSSNIKHIQSQFNAGYIFCRFRGIKPTIKHFANQTT